MFRFSRSSVFTAALFLLAALLLAACQNSPMVYGDKSMRKEGAQVVITVYGDYQCPSCRYFARNVQPKIVKDFVETGKAELQFRHMVLLGPESIGAAMAAECADEQGKFWPYHDRLYQDQITEQSGAFTSEKLQAWAVEMGVDEAKFAECIASSATWDSVRENTEAATALKIPSAPAVLIDGVLVPYEEWDGEYEGLKPIIEQKIAGK